MKRSVFIIGGSLAYQNMFTLEGWQTVDSVQQADLVQFTGGEDVDPSFYGARKHPKTGSNPIRDGIEKRFFDAANYAGVPMAGICRGGQFLNVMNGGKMYQHVDKHAIPGTHEVMDKITGELYQATSTHHQMMVPTREADIIAVAYGLSTKRELERGGKMITIYGPNPDAEVLYYRKTNSLCFQPHPELPGQVSLRSRYFKYIEDLLLTNKRDEQCAVS